LHLLPKEAREVIGRVHEQTKPALAMLEAQGFRRNGYIDIFDAGPSVACDTSKIRAIETTRVVTAVTSPPSLANDTGKLSERAIVSTTGSPFRSVQCDVKQLEKEVALPIEAIELLQLEAGQSVCVTH
jgi:arginine N-succinyltransferase